MVLKPHMVTAGCRVTGDYGAFLLLEPEDGSGVSMGPQRVPEPRTGKNRAHVDFPAGDREVEVRRLEGLGATVLGEQEVHGLRWTVLADACGNEFCVAG
ncbi:VOC family protein [Planosporangium flavigriseum]|uniref:Glyoxalase-like domain-containing protein n=1 Tax=Planosporangium flavigriseum TaxID=373681 RepID=A0A8J3PQ98_9ACTN|nr:VOC family protein [Planosporangium flavigriseum]NJC67026.1 VOC family protein [Planosporangium flavigriseum]GIG76728.1 hypothetical protein Pfl04_51320 [Planosporangium flavigriseum]